MSVRRSLVKNNASSNITDGLIHYYPLVSNSNDAVGGINGTDEFMFYNADAGDFQDTADFTSSINSAIDLGDSASFSFGNGTTDSDFTFHCRFVLDSNSGTSIIFAKRGASAGTEKEYQLYYSSPSTLTFRMFDQSSGKIFEVSRSFPITLGTVYKCSVTHESGTLTLYASESGSSDGSPATNSTPEVGYVAMENLGGSLMLGKSPTLTSQSLDGYEGEFAIWNVSKSSSEIASIPTPIM